MLTRLLDVDYEAVVAEDLPNGWEAGQNVAFAGTSYFEISGGKISVLVDSS